MLKRVKISTTVRNKSTQITNCNDIVNEYDIIIFDTCAILDNKAFERYTSSVMNQLKKNEKKFAIPYAVMKEIEYHSKAITTNCKSQAQRALVDIKALEYIGMISFIGNKDRSEQADHAILRYASAKRFDCRILIVTNDNDLTYDLRSLNNSVKARAYPVQVAKLSLKGELIMSGFENKDIRSIKSIGPSKPTTGFDAILKRYGM